MVLKQFTVDFKELSNTANIRLWKSLSHSKTKYPLSAIMNYIDTLESGNRPKGGIMGIEDGAISLGGEQIDPRGYVDLSNMPLIPLDFYENAKSGKVNKNDILICKDGALTGKVCIVDIDFPVQEVMINEHVYLIRSLSDVANQKFLFYLFRSKFVQHQIQHLAFKKKGQPGLNLGHLKQIRIPLVPKPIQDQIMLNIEPIEEKIKQLKPQIIEPQTVINAVIAREFSIDLSKMQTEEQKKQFFLSSALTYRNPHIRSSVRWHKILPIQQFMYENCSCIRKLGRFIMSTQNGWSPSCMESDSTYGVFGVNCISKNAVINYEDLKYTDQTCENINSYFAKRNDLFVSRGNTVDLVALASVVEDLPNEKDLIFPDLFIRLDIDEDFLNKKYLAYLFNSIIGRYYFKYSAKGKNQTMVKISSDELNWFFLPVPTIEIQKRIVDDIKAMLDVQEVIKTKIEAEINKIDQIIVCAIEEK